MARASLRALVAAVVVPIAAARRRTPTRASTAPARRGARSRVDQWRADVARQGLSVNYQGVGSTSGRVVLLPGPGRLRGVGDPVHARVPRRDGNGDHRRGRARRAPARTRTCPTSPAARRSCTTSRSTASGSTNLRLSPDTIAKIFTGVHQELERSRRSPPTTGSCTLPSLPIRPIVRSDGSGTTAQFTAFMAQPDLRHRGTRSAAVAGCTSNPCPSVSLWPDINAHRAAVLRRRRRLTSPRPTTTARSPTSSTATPSSAASRSRRCSTRPATSRQPTAEDVAIALARRTLNADRTQNLARRVHEPATRARIRCRATAT